MDNETNSRGAPLLVGLQVEPYLALTLESPTQGLKYIAPLTPVSAQALAHALLAAVGREPLPELLAAIRKEAKNRATRDGEFLASCGVNGGGAS